nr:hypothetical protein [Tanacetum cinerariifolium]
LDIIHLQFQMEECYKMLTDQVDWMNPEGDQVRIDSQRIQDQAAQSRYEYVILDSKGHDKEQRVHNGYRKATEDEKDLPESGMLCWWMHS